MAKTSVDIDMDKLNKVCGILGTESIRETINAAFREVILLEPGAEDPGGAHGAGAAPVGLDSRSHHDRDFDTIARYTEQPVRWMVPPGAVLPHQRQFSAPTRQRSGCPAV